MTFFPEKEDFFHFQHLLNKMSNIEELIDEDGNECIIFECPSCNCCIQVKKSEINCKIFRCGVLKETMQSIDPHLSFEKCNELVEKNLIFGCGAAFRLISEPVVQIVLCSHDFNN